MTKLDVEIPFDGQFPSGRGLNTGTDQGFVFFTRNDIDNNNR